MPCRREPRLRFLSPWALAATLVAPLAAAGCAGGAGATSERYPEKKRPEPARSASDGEVLGAHRQSPEDTLDSSLTNLHSAPASPHADSHEAHERLEYEQCLEENRAAEAEPAADGKGKKKRICQPPPEPRTGD